MLATKTRDVEASDVEQAREVKAEVKEEMEPATLEMAKGVLAGNRVSLSRAITLIESWKESHTLQAQYLLEYVLKDRQEKGIDATSSFRLGICGTPGSGKSSTIERLGTMLVRDKGQRVAVLAVDPSSARSGGSILGDKTRMTELSKLEEAYVRPSPTRGSLGGVAQHTNDVVLLCEAAGFDIVIVESVGLGQSEVLIDEVVDMTVLLAAPAGGDELQGVKKGIMEIADMVVVNKADGDLEKVARHAATDYMHALQLMRRKREAWRPRVKKCSALRNTGIEDVWQVVEKFRKTMTESGDLLLKRQQQNRSWMWNQFNEQLMFRAKHDPELHHLADDLAETLGQGYGTPRHAARTLVSEFLRKNAPAPPSSSSSSTSS
ncbi:Methylmalonic aciduria type A-like, mitochondrial [Hondaea fermentalgiana]|uniref:Methylmalonic aciduria type A-like, mitochondrial n=1 Tax=Hondaea fermentalgiana TaxID=2315210 RepID=A0A2R5GRF8_9STRA|nr:Methylmalonic aciduria type A-like, mitochondrial [Hondaea fermentalgiana]|eukprot:GBG31223.1 Methylmalonic aciduria type A-like, mitochondrial [Hondaea fermentalgiana]